MSMSGSRSAPALDRAVPLADADSRRERQFLRPTVSGETEAQRPVGGSAYADSPRQLDLSGWSGERWEEHQRRICQIVLVQSAGDPQCLAQPSRPGTELLPRTLPAHLHHPVSLGRLQRPYQHCGGVPHRTGDDVQTPVDDTYAVPGGPNMASFRDVRPILSAA